MKFIYILSVVVVIAALAVLADPRRDLVARYAGPGPRPSPFSLPGWSWVKPYWDTFTSLPDIISHFFPSAHGIFSTSKNLVAGTPVKYMAYYVNKVCGIARKWNILNNQKLSVAKEDMYVLLYNPQGSDMERIPIHNPQDLIEHPFFNADYNLTIFFTGWGGVEDKKGGVVNVLREAYRKRGSHNFVVFDLASYVDNLYRWVTLDTFGVAAKFGFYLSQLSQKFPISRVHLIGHSLGAHVAGMTGNNFRNSNKMGIPRITALDPAVACLDEQMVIRRGDADFVDVIHTDSGALGGRDPMGDVDFYPNGPVPLQPGCLNVVCAHNLAVNYYAESVVPGAEYNFMALRCGTINEYKVKGCAGKPVPMGYATPTNLKGKYYLETNAKSPYGKNSE